MISSRRFELSALSVKDLDTYGSNKATPEASKDYMLIGLTGLVIVAYLQKSAEDSILVGVNSCLRL